MYRWGLEQGIKTREAVQTLLGATSSPKIASAVLTSISKNVLFVVDTERLACVEDLKCDDMDAWSAKGKNSSWFREDDSGDAREISVPDEDASSLQKVFRQHYVNDSLPSLKKVIITVESSSKPHRYALVQFIFTEGEQKFVMKPHGNFKRGEGRIQKPYRRTMKSTKELVKGSQGKPREIFHTVMEQRGGIHGVRSSGEYPRDRTQIYNIRRHAMMKDAHVPSTSGAGVSDPLLAVLQRAKEQQQTGNIFSATFSCHLNRWCSWLLISSYQMSSAFAQILSPFVYLVLTQHLILLATTTPLERIETS